MTTKIIEASGNNCNWGKFLLGRFDVEWAVRSVLPQAEPEQLPSWEEHPAGRLAMATQPLLSLIGIGPEQLLVLDLQTGEGSLFSPGGAPDYDLDKHAIWTCPLFPSFLAWLYQQDLSDLTRLPTHIALPEAPPSFVGQRGKGRRRG